MDMNFTSDPDDEELFRRAHPSEASYVVKADIIGYVDRSHIVLFENLIGEVT